MIGDRLKELRRRHNLTQEEIADRLNISRGTYAHYEVNKRQPDYDTLKKFADFFGCTTDYLLEHYSRNKTYYCGDMVISEDELFSDLKLFIMKTDIVYDGVFIDDRLRQRIQDLLEGFFWREKYE